MTTPMMTVHIKHYCISDTVAKLRREYSGGRPVTCNMLYKRVRDGLVTATPFAGRFGIAETDIPRIAEMFGLVPVGSTGPASPPRD